MRLLPERWPALLMQYRCTAVKLHRPRSIDIAVITAHLPTALPTLDAQQAFDNVEHQVANAQLMMILDRAEERL